MNDNFKTENKSQDKYYKKYLIAIFLILALPLLAVPPTFHPAAWGKAIVFRIIISVLVFFIVWQIISKKTDNRLLVNAKKTLYRENKVFWPFWLLISLWIIFLLATIFSQDPYYSFWESPFRAGGFLNFSLYIIFAVLAFLIIKEKDWQKIWDFCIIVGILASIMAILQYFHLFEKYLVPHEGHPPATFGNSMFLAIYLLFLIFLALFSGLKEKKYFKKIFYFSVIPLFIFIVLITNTRAVYLGLLVGALYFFLLYPKKILWLKIIATIFLFLIVIGVFYINTQDQLPEFIQNNKVLRAITSRLSFELLSQEARFSAWQVAFEGVKEKPILGWGPENFSIAFDKHYDSRLPELPRIWWDRAHNFIFDIAISAGIPALIIYLSLFGALLWQLQKVKKKNPNDALICHGIQAAFIGYLTSNLFSFDSFSTYLISFLLIAYSLFLIQKNSKFTEDGPLQTYRGRASVSPLWKSALIFGLFCLLIVFIWFGALKPLSINKEINWALHYSKNGQCEKALEKMDNILSSHSNIGSYVRLQYLDIIRACLKEDNSRKYTLAPKAISALKEVAEIRPYYTRTWISLGNYLNILIENNHVFKIENVDELKKEAYSYFEKAHELSPKREEVFLGWILTDFLSEKYQAAKEKAEQCLNLNPEITYCWWKKGLANIYLHDLEEADKDMTIAIEQGHNPKSAKSLSELQKAYIKVLETIEEEEKELYMECYEKLADVYRKLITHVSKNNFQYHASLAHIYKILGEYEKARETALKVASLLPEARLDIEEFFKSILVLDNDHAMYHFYSARLYYLFKQYEDAEYEAHIARQYSIPGTQAQRDIDEFLKNLYKRHPQLKY